MHRREDNIKKGLKQDVRLWTGFKWLRIGTSGGVFWTRVWNFWKYRRWRLVSLSRRNLLHGILVKS